MNRMYDTCMRLGCQERAKGGVECHETCVRADQSGRPPVEPADGLASRMIDDETLLEFITRRVNEGLRDRLGTTPLGLIDRPRYGDDLGIPARPRTSAGVRTMADLMRRSRVERDFGGVEDA